MQSYFQDLEDWEIRHFTHMDCFHRPAERREVRGREFLKMTYRMAGYVRIVATVLEIAPTKKA
jgi:hypothetical protein